MRKFGTLHQTLLRLGGGGFCSELTGLAALAVVATELAIMFFGATLPTPLYPLYRARSALAK